MPAIQTISARKFTGWYPTLGASNLSPEQLIKAENMRFLPEGGMATRPGYEDSEINLSSYSFTRIRGMFYIAKYNILWIAGDDGTNTKLVYALSDDTVYDSGLSNTTAKEYDFDEYLGDLYYVNGVENPGVIFTSSTSGSTASASTTVNLRPGDGIKFPSSGTGSINGDTFTWGGKTGDQLTGCAGISGVKADGSIVISTATYTPGITDPTTIAFWIESNNLGGDTETPWTWEFSKIADSTNLDYVRNFTAGGTEGTEIVGGDNGIKKFVPTKDYMYIFTGNAVYFTPKDNVNATTGARIPEPLTKQYGIPNFRCAVVMEGLVAFWTGERLIPIQIVVENGASSVEVNDKFDLPIRTFLSSLSTDHTEDWLHYNPRQRLLKLGITHEGAKKVVVYDFKSKAFSLDTGKSYGMMVNAFDGKSFAGSEFDGTIWIDEQGLSDNGGTIAHSWEGGSLVEHAFATLRRARYYGKMGDNSEAIVTLYNNQSSFERTITDTSATITGDASPVGSAGVGTSGVGDGGSVIDSFDFDYPIRCLRTGTKFKHSGICEGEGFFFQIDGIELDFEPHRHTPVSSH